MSSHEQFPMESRLITGTKSYATHTGIHCCECKRWDWRKAGKPGIANRVFHNAGWRIGSRRNQDVCPECLALHQNRKPGTVPLEDRVPVPPPPFNDAMAAQLAAVFKAQTGADDVKADDTLTVTIVAEPEPVAIVPDKPLTPGQRVQMYAEAKAAKPPMPELVWPKFVENTSVKTGYRTRIATSEFTQFTNAQRAATNFHKSRGITTPRINRDYIIYGCKGDWSWMSIVLPKPPPMPPRNFTGREKVETTALPPPKPTKRKYVWSGKYAKKEPKTMIEDTMGTALTKADYVASTAQPTREQRQAIAGELDTRYDIVKGRYKQDGSDEKLSQKMNMPRAWITRIRLDLYGDHDRNELVDRNLIEITAALALASKAKERLLTMASEAEAIETDLTARLRRIKGI